MRDHIDGGDAGLVDLLLHPQDRAYTVPQLAALAEAAGLAITAFVEPAAYDPATYIRDPKLLKRLDGLPWLERCAVAEAMAGSMKTHVCYLAPKAAAEGRVAGLAQDAVLVPRDIDPAAIAEALKPGQPLPAKIVGVGHRPAAAFLGPPRCCG